MRTRRRLTRREEFVGIGLVLPYVCGVVWLVGDDTAMAWKPLLAPPGAVLFLGWYLWRTRRRPEPLPAAAPQHEPAAGTTEDATPQ
jgi:hypothetical protein